ncbi:MAG: heavy metal translocating P-type ATPase [Lachnospiraceae bacterium]|nr:heavy metal translocating P-type ATPase [Lachnospiraceae bacterium]
MKKEKFAVTGMTCSACSSRVEKCVSSLEGISVCDVNLLTGSMQTAYDESKLNAADIIAAVEKAGYGVSSLTPASDTGNTGSPAGNSLQETMLKARKEMKNRLVFSFLFLIPLMYVSMYHMFYEWFHLPIPGFILRAFHGPENAVTFAFTQFLLLLPILYLNQNYFIHGFKNLFRRSPNMDSLVAVGSAAAVVYGVFVIFRLSHGLGYQDMELIHRYGMEIYFESAGTILTLITLGKYLESRSKAQTGKAIEKLVNLAPKTALLLTPDGGEREIPADEVKEGDIVILKPGAYVPVDGVIVSGFSSLDESAITGESIPVEKTTGDTVISASLNKNGSFRMRAVKTGENTTINQIIRLVEEASSSKAPIAKLADKIAGIFVPAVMCIALLAFAAWMFSGAGFEFSLSIGISVLVISCPCALGLATPVAIMVGTGKGAENGILIKSGEALETAHSIGTVVLDKTGTITNGKPEVTDVLPFDLSERELLSVAVMLEKQSEHPLAEAILTYAPEDIQALSAESFEALFGLGVRCTYRSDLYFAGNKRLLQEEGFDLAAIEEDFTRLSEEGKTVLLFAKKASDGASCQILGMIAVADVEKASSLEAIRQFEELGIDVVMLTGDNEKTAAAIGKRLHIKHVIAQVLPNQKEEKIKELMADGHKVAMIGDGINDAPALARADVGIAIGAGTDVAIESADAVLIKNDLMDAVNAIRLSKSVIRNIKENLFWAFFYNSIGIPLAAGVLYPAFGLKLNPMFGAAAMSLSSICVVFNALRLRLFKPLRTDIPSTTNLSEKGEKTMKELTLSIEGMMCMHCQKHTLDALNAIEGVTAEVNLEEKKAYVKTDREIADDVLKKAVADAGYEVTEIMRG